MLSTIEILLMPTCFVLLFGLMLLYWGQTAFFSFIKYKKITSFLFYLASLCLTVLLLLRWFESGHLPLSNLYESLLFLSWSFLSIQVILQVNTQKSRALPDKESFSEVVVTTPEKQSFSEVAVATQTAKLSSFCLQNEDFAEQNLSFASKTTRSRASHILQSQSLAVELPDFADQNSRNLSFCKQNNEVAVFHSSMLSDPMQNEKQELVDLIAVIFSPMALLTYTFAFLNLPKEMQKATALVPALQSNWLMMHVSVMILSYAALISGCLLAITYLLLFYVVEQLDLTPEKASLSEVIVTTPDKQSYQPLQSKSLSEKLDNYSYRLIGIGFPLLTIGILSGAVWANSAWGSYWSWDPKETWALITWLVFAIYLHARITRGWSGKRAAIIATVAFFVVWFCFLGVNLLGTGLHSYGWFTK